MSRRWFAIAQACGGSSGEAGASVALQIVVVLKESDGRETDLGIQSGR
jgi:hypothetical protein